MQRIFDYYLDRADKRRNQAVSAEKVGQRDIRSITTKDLGSGAVSAKTQQLQQLKDQARAQKSLIGYREYVQVLFSTFGDQLCSLPLIFFHCLVHSSAMISI